MKLGDEHMMSMKKLWLSLVGLAALGLGAPASAADLAVHPYRMAAPPMVAAIYDWSGFYIGLTAAGGRPTTAGIFLPQLEQSSVMDVPMLLEEYSVGSSAIAGNRPIGCSVWKRRAIGRTSAVRVSA